MRFRKKQTAISFPEALYFLSVVTQHQISLSLSLANEIAGANRPAALHYCVAFITVLD